MNRPIAQLAICLLLASVTACMADMAPAKPPNVLVFLVDDMGIMDTSVPFLTDGSGEPKTYPLNDYFRTPSMERLSANGTRLNNFYAMSVCSPTRISIMTGQNASRHRSTNWINPTKDNRGPMGPPKWNWQGLTQDDVTLPRLLAAAGYHTIHVGKGHFGPRDYPGADPLNLGFDVNIAGHCAGRPASYYGLKNFSGAKPSVHSVPGLEKYHGQDIYLTEALTIEAKQQLTNAVKADKPFYLYMAHYAVHGPFQPDSRFADNYAKSGKNKNAQAFATMIEGMDKSLGDLLDHVQELGVAEETLVLFLGDNGSDAPLGGPHEIACAAPLRGKKGSHYEGGMRVPFIAAWAKPEAGEACQRKWPIRPGVIRSQIASVCDLLPTVLEVAGVAVPSDQMIDGHSLCGLLAGKAGVELPDEFLMHYPHGPHRSKYFTTFRQGDWKAIYHWHPDENPQGKRYELYNLAEDFTESNDLAGKEPDQLSKMMNAMNEQLKQHEALSPMDRNNRQALRMEMP